jgi:hypothetical protein
MFQNKLWFKVVIYVMLISMALSTILMSFSFFM